MSDTVLVLTHVPKTAGTALWSVAKANYGARNFVDLDVELVRGRPNLARGGERTVRNEALEFFGTYYGSLAPARKSEVGCFLGHSAPMFIPAVTDRPVRAFCLLRDPVERVQSLYLHLLRRQKRPKSMWTHLPRFLEPMQREGWTLKDVYRELGSRSGESFPLRDSFWSLFDGQARHLLMGTVDPAAMSYNPDAEELDDYKRKVDRLLADSYVVGTQDRFSQSVRLFADTFGWRMKFLPRANANPNPAGRDEIDDETRDLIRSHNRLDAELHARYSERLRDLPYTSRVSDVRWKARQRAAKRVLSFSKKLRAGMGT